MRVVEELDAGPVYLAGAGADPAPTTTTARWRRGSPPSPGELLVRALDERPEPRDAAEDGITYAEKITPEERRLDPARAADELARTVRALTPHIGAWAEMPRGRSASASGPRGPGGTPGLQPGELAVRDSRLLLGTARRGAGAARGAAARASARCPPPTTCAAVIRRPPSQSATVNEKASTSGPECPGCGEPWLRGTNLAGRYRCVYCLRRFELRCECPHCGDALHDRPDVGHRQRDLQQLRRVDAARDLAT